MSKSKRETSLLQNCRNKTPSSFSSSLLDSIYDESTPHHRRDSSLSPNYAAAKKHNHRGSGTTTAAKHDHSLKRAIMIEEWIEKQNPFSSTSLSSSSDSSSGAGFTKTTKLRALQFYGELKKVKQPISPGARISTFLNSIFNSKKAKMCHVGAVDDVAFKSKSAPCSAVSSFSRSCMTKAAEDSSRSRVKKRSVRFYPVSVIIGEVSRPCGHKPVYYDDQEVITMSNKDTSSMAVKMKKKCVAGLYEEEDEEEDTESCVSSDLFELDHLIGIGRRYREEELPVYETTCLKKNHAIATAFNL